MRTRESFVVIINFAWRVGSMLSEETMVCRPVILKLTLLLEPKDWIHIRLLSVNPVVLRKIQIPSKLPHIATLPSGEKATAVMIPAMGDE
jgi:hypothetical protein